MANPSMDRDVVAWLRQQLQEAHPDLLRELLATMVQELIGAEAQQGYGQLIVADDMVVVATPLDWTRPARSSSYAKHPFVHPPGALLLLSPWDLSIRGTGPDTEPAHGRRD